MYRSKSVGTLLMIIGLLFSGACMAVDPSGNWVASNGAKIQILADQTSVSVTISNQGRSGKYGGRWLEMGSQFSYLSGNVTYKALIADHNNITVYDPQGNRFSWKRVQLEGQGQNTGQQAAAPGKDISGLWQSSTGNSVQLSSRGNQVIVTLIRTDGGRVQGSGRWLQPGYKFDYSIPGFPGVATGTIVSQTQISVISQEGKPTVWTRQ